MYPKKIDRYCVPFYGEKEQFPQGSPDLTNVSIHHNCSIGMHSHDFWEINIVLRGEGCHYIGDMAIPLSSGEFFVLPPKVEHGYYCTSELDVCHITLHHKFLEKYGSELSEVPGYSTLFEIEPYLRQVYDDSFFLKIGEEKLDCVRSEIADIMSVTGDEFAPYRNILVLRFLADMCYYRKMRRIHKAETVSSNIHILRVLEYIQNHYAEQITVEHLMQIANMSRPTFHRHFKLITKMTPLEYIIKCRVNAAEILLSKGQLSRTEIAQKCGFFDTSHMNKYLGK